MTVMTTDSAPAATRLPCARCSRFAIWALQIKRVTTDSDGKQTASHEYDVHSCSDCAVGARPGMHSVQPADDGSTLITTLRRISRIPQLV